MAKKFEKICRNELAFNRWLNKRGWYILEMIRNKESFTTQVARERKDESGDIEIVGGEGTYISSGQLWVGFEKEI